MNSKIVLGLSLLGSVFSAYANNCGNLNVSIYNDTGYTCSLRTNHLISGALIFGEVPQTLESGAKAISFTLQQTYSEGPHIHLDYDCNKSTVSIHSRQDLCVVRAGLVKGNYNTNGAVHADYNTVDGSWWDSRPGQINWNIG